MTSANPVGRPLKFESVEELETQINLYFDDCNKEEDTRVWAHDEIQPDDDGKRLCTNCWKAERSKGCLLVSGRLKLPRPYTVTGLALWLNTTRQALLEYQGEVEGREHHSAYAGTIAAAKLKIENYASERLFDAGTPTRGVIFSLSNNSQGWTEKSEVTSKSIDQMIKDQESSTPPDANSRS